KSSQPPADDIFKCLHIPMSGRERQRYRSSDLSPIARETSGEGRRGSSGANIGALSISRSPLLAITWPLSQLLDAFSDRTHHRNRPLSGRSVKRLGLDP